jgi:hypothetical protein
MAPPTHFVSKLPAGHEILSALRPALMGMLRANPLLSPMHEVAAGGIQACREQCAAMLWIFSGLCTLGALKQSTPVASIALCTVLGLPVSPVAPAAQAARILQHLNDKNAAVDNSAQAAGGHPGGDGAAAQVAAPQHGGFVEQALPGAAAAAAPLLPAPPRAAQDDSARAAPANGVHGVEDDDAVQIRPRS